VLDLRKSIRAGKGDTGRTGFLTNPDLEPKLSATEKASGTAQFICENQPNREFGMIAECNCGVSNALANDGSKGSGTNLSTMIAAVWSEWLIGHSGTGADIVVDPCSKRTTRLVGCTVSSFGDIAVRHPLSFCALTDAVTT